MALSSSTSDSPAFHSKLGFDSKLCEDFYAEAAARLILNSETDSA
jgi:hypothetical protein